MPDWGFGAKMLPPTSASNFRLPDALSGQWRAVGADFPLQNDPQKSGLNGRGSGRQFVQEQNPLTNFVKGESPFRRGEEDFPITVDGQAGKVCWVVDGRNQGHDRKSSF